MYNNILLPVVFDDTHDTQASIRAAHALAQDGAQLTLLHVMEAIPMYVAAEIPSIVFENTRSTADKSLAELAETVPGAKTAMVSGQAGRSIVDYAKKHDVDCIIVASHQPGLEDFFLGSTADRVVRHAPCAVHVIR